MVLKVGFTEPVWYQNVNIYIFSEDYSRLCISRIDVAEKKNIPEILNTSNIAFLHIWNKDRPVYSSMMSIFATLRIRIQRHRGLEAIYSGQQTLNKPPRRRKSRAGSISNFLFASTRNLLLSVKQHIIACSCHVPCSKAVFICLQNIIYCLCPLWDKHGTNRLLLLLNIAYQIDSGWKLN